MATPDRAPVTQWLIALLEADPGAFGVGDGAAPEGPVEYPYLVVWSIPGGGYDGPPLGASQGDATFVYQVDSVGRTRQQAEALAGRMTDRVSGRAADGSYAAAAGNPAGLRISDRIAGGVAGSIPEGDRPNEVWTVPQTFAISVTTS